MRVQVVSNVDALDTVAETVSMFNLAFSREVVMLEMTVFMARREESSRRREVSWEARASSWVSRGAAGGAW